MPRRNRTRREPERAPAARQGSGVTAVRYAGRAFEYREVRGSAEGSRSYRCPGCEQDVPSSSAHVVAWPSDGAGGVGDRRHWHTRCWGARERRLPAGPIL